jgi:regulator of sirC expression with transglutaminase-like and TPR domain
VKAEVKPSVHPDRSSLAAELHAAVAREPIDLGAAALLIARLEYPQLDPTPSIARLDDLGARARALLAPLTGAPASLQLSTIASLLYERSGFTGNREYYDDFRNSCLNVVLERKLGIPITLGVVFMEVARRAGVDVRGVSFPGHFLLRGPDDASGRPVILDPFSSGRSLSETDLRALLVRMEGEEAIYSSELLKPCSPQQLLARMLNNLKRTYVELRSFQQAYAATDLMLAVDPTLLMELRDRGLLAYHLNNYQGALRDLEQFVRLNAWTGEAERKERDEIWDHVKNLRRRIAALN